MTQTRSRLFLVASLVLLLSSFLVHCAPPKDAPEKDIGTYVKQKVGDVVGTVKNKIGSEWGGSKVKEAEAEIPHQATGEIEYVRVRPVDWEQATRAMGNGNIFSRAWYALSSRLGMASHKASLASQQAYDQVIGIKNSAGQTWDQAMANAYDTWMSGKESTKETWESAKGKAWDAWSKTVTFPEQAAQKTADTMKAGYETATTAATSAPSYITDAAAQSWYSALSSAYDAWMNTKSTTHTTWDQAKQAAWNQWKSTSGSMYQGYDYTTDTVADAYEKALQSVYDSWKSTKDKSGQGWDSVKNAFNTAWISSMRHPEDVVENAWDDWQQHKHETGETWDERKKRAMEEWEERKKMSGMDAIKGMTGEWSEGAIRRWESWLKHAWSRWQSSNIGNQTTATMSETFGGGDKEGVLSPETGAIANETWERAKQSAKRAYHTVSISAAQPWEKAREAARSAWESTKEYSSSAGDKIPWEEALSATWSKWMDTKAFAGSTWNEAMKEADRFWKETKGKSKEGYSDFLSTVWTNWSRARNAAGTTWDDAELAAKQYWKAVKGTTKQTWNDVSDAAWKAWVEGVAARGGTWDDVQDAVKKRYEETKKTSKIPFDEFVTQTKHVFDQATSGPSSWLSNMSDTVACAWDSARCQPGSIWLGLKETLHLAKEDSAQHAQRIRREAHGKVDELYAAVKSEL